MPRASGGVVFFLKPEGELEKIGEMPAQIDQTAREQRCGKISYHPSDQYETNDCHRRPAELLTRTGS